MLIPKKSGQVVLIPEKWTCSAKGKRSDFVCRSGTVFTEKPRLSTYFPNYGKCLKTSALEFKLLGENTPKDNSNGPNL